jgi:hypothetical protein
MRWEFFDRDPITIVRQSAKRDRTPEVLTADKLKALLAACRWPSQWSDGVLAGATQPFEDSYGPQVRTPNAGAPGALY